MSIVVLLETVVLGCSLKSCSKNFLKIHGKITSVKHKVSFLITLQVEVSFLIMLQAISYTLF